MKSFSQENALLYGNENGIPTLKKVSSLQSMVHWINLCWAYHKHRHGIEPRNKKEFLIDLPKIQKAYQDLKEVLSGQVWDRDEYRQEMLLAAEGACVMAELQEKLDGKNLSRITDTHAWLAKYREKWLQKNKENELFRIEDMFNFCESL